MNRGVMPGTSRRRISLKTNEMKKEKMAKTASLKNGKTVWAAYWTTLQKNDRMLLVRFRFPMAFGMLRAAEQVAGEAAELARWLRRGELKNAEALSIERLQWVMPYHEGTRKLLNAEGLMDLTLGAKQFQVEMLLPLRGTATERLADALEDAAEDMAWWMVYNAYSLRLQ